MEIIKENTKDYNYRQMYLKIYNFMQDFDAEYELMERTNPDKVKDFCKYGLNTLNGFENEIKNLFKENKINVSHYNKLMFQIHGNNKHNYGRS